MLRELMPPLLYGLAALIGGWNVGRSVRLYFTPYHGKAMSVFGRFMRMLVGVLGGLILTAIGLFLGVQKFGDAALVILSALALIGLVIGLMLPPAFWHKLNRTGIPGLVIPLGVLAVGGVLLYDNYRYFQTRPLPWSLVFGVTLTVIGFIALVNAVTTMANRIDSD